MDVSLTFTDFQSALEEFRQQTRAEHHLLGCETILTLPKEFGTGKVRYTNLREGLNLLINEQFLDENLTLKFKDILPDDAPIALKFCLSGHTSGCIQGISDDICLSSGGLCLVYCPEHIGKVRFAEKTQIQTVELSITPNLFKDLMGQDCSYLGELDQSLYAASHLPYWQLGKTVPAMKTALQQLFHCPYHGATRRLYMESKGLELIALYLDQLKTNQLTPKKSYSLRPDDIRRIHQAKNILISQIDHPPSLLSLARQVGINDCKLKQGFRQVFGTTVFGYLQNHRIERAAQLLRENNMTVSGVSYAVGFAHRGAFAAAFRRKFGVNPSDYRKIYLKQYWVIDQKSPPGDHGTSG